MLFLGSRAEVVSSWRADDGSSSAGACGCPVTPDLSRCNLFCLQVIRGANRGSCRPRWSGHLAWQDRLPIQGRLTSSHGAPCGGRKEEGGRRKKNASSVRSSCSPQPLGHLVHYLRIVQRRKKKSRYEMKKNGEQMSSCHERTLTYRLKEVACRIVFVIYYVYIFLYLTLQI